MRVVIDGKFEFILAIGIIFHILDEAIPLVRIAAAEPGSAYRVNFIVVQIIFLQLLIAAYAKSFSV